MTSLKPNRNAAAHTPTSAVRFAKRQGFQQNAIHNAEDCRIRSHTRRDGDQCYRGEHRGARQAAHHVPECVGEPIRLYTNEVGNSSQKAGLSRPEAPRLRMGVRTNMSGDRTSRGLAPESVGGCLPLRLVVGGPCFAEGSPNLSPLTASPRCSASRRGPPIRGYAAKRNGNRRS